MIISKTKTTKRKLAKKLGISVSSLYYKPKREIIDNEIKSQIEAVLTDNPAYGHKRIALAFYSHFKVDIADVNRFQDITELIEEINYQIWYYNNERIHGRIKTTPKNRLENYYKLRGT